MEGFSAVWDVLEVYITSTGVRATVTNMWPNMNYYVRISDLPTLSMTFVTQWQHTATFKF